LTAASAEDALKKIHSDDPDLLLTDNMMPEMSGMDLLKRVKAISSDLPVVMITAYADIPGAVQAIKSGAQDYLAKPFEHNEVVRVILRALRGRQLAQKASILSRDSRLDSPLRKLMGPSEVINRLATEISLVAQSNFSVIIFGETGSGKELAARAIHEESVRSSKCFIPVDCGAIPENLFESEFFGCQKGAFTGATENKSGLFRTAHGGTLLLDEVSNMPFGSQAKLLRALQEKCICPLGSTKVVNVDVRVIAATNQNLRELTASGSFREDLYFRLSEYVIHVPPLRDRIDDIPHLTRLFLESTNKELGKNVRKISEKAMQVLLDHDWPGNVRELRTVIRRAVLLADETIRKKELKIQKMRTSKPKVALKSHNVQWNGESLRDVVRECTIDVEREILVQALHQTHGNKAAAARLLKVDYKTILSKLKEYRIDLNGE